ncbi:MAG: hypothetical protein ACOX8S_07560 [Christensenellales bacterium]
MLVLLVLLALIFTACTQTPQPTATSDTTKTPAPAATNPGASAAAATADPVEPEKKEPVKLTISVAGFAAYELQDDDVILNALEELVNADIHLLPTPDKSYDEKFNAMLAGGTLPDVVFVNSWTTDSMKMALEAGAFWEIGPYLEQFENLSQADSETLRFASVDGKIYGLHRDRQVGRLGFAYRKDWAENLGFSAPATIEEVYDMCYAFATQDPDGNGQADSLGFVEQSSLGAMKTMMIWFGAPNEYGVDENGNFFRDCDTQEWINCLDFYRKMFANGVINEDFVTASSRNNLMRGGLAGAMVGIIDDAVGFEDTIRDIQPDVKIDIIGWIDCGAGIEPRSAAENNGFKAYYGFPTTNTKTEERLLDLLGVFDKLNTFESNNLLTHGVEDLHYSINADGLVTKTDEQKDAKDNTGGDLGQLQTFKFTVNPALPLLQDEVRTLGSQLIDENTARAVFNKNVGLVSETAIKNGKDLDNIIKDAMVKYIMGQIDLDGLKAAVADWHARGGDAVLAEYTEAYKQIGK